MSDQGREAHLGSVLRYALAAASFGAGVIHVTAIFDHTDHAVVAGFFVALTVVQIAWAAALLRRPSAALLQAGAAISAGAVVIWLLSRITGFPGVPGAEEPEAFGLKDGMASLLEVLLAVGVVAQFVPRAQGLRVASGRLASAVAVSVVGVLTAAGLSAPRHGHHHDGGAHDHAGSAAAGDPAHGDNDHGHGGAGTGGPHGHTHNAASAGQHDAAHAHDAGGAAHHADGQDHHSSSFALAAGAADHDHNAPGHVLDPSHHHAPGHVHDPSHHHASGHVHDPSHHHDQPEQSHETGGHAEPPHDHDHGTGDHHYGGGDPGDADACTSPLPANQVVTRLQETAQSTVGAGCRLRTSSPTGDHHRHSPLQCSAQHFIS